MRQLLMMRQLLIAGLVLVVLFPMPGIARRPAQDPIQKRSKALAGLKSGSLIRVHTQSLGKFVGRYHSSTDDSLFISYDNGKSSLPIAAIDALWVRGRATWKGTKTGAIVGVAAGTILGIVVALACGSDQGLFGGGPEPCPEAISIGAGAGGVAGGLVGAGLGTAFTKWHLRFRLSDYGIYSDLSEAEYAAYSDGGVGYSDDISEAVQPNRLRISIVPDIGNGGINVSASFAF